jgi:hypothetical protein
MTSAALHLTIRFSSGIADLDIDIPSPRSTTVLTLKHLLRKRIASRSRLRLIHQGRLLSDPLPLSSVLRAPLPPPPSAASNKKDDDYDPKGKGKAIAGGAPVRIYVNCSIGDELSDEELQAETEAAEKPQASPTEAEAAAASGSQTAPPPSTRPRPRGFDRLLTSGFTASEISTLRTQFASIHSDRFAPDAPPSPDTLRGMEDAWIDSNAQQPGVATGAGDENDPSGLAHALDVFFRAMVIGFFFPLGSITWLLRQEGIWSEKWQIFVASGVVLSLTIGMVVSLSGDETG